MERKRKKNTRLRGSHTHGWGAKKKHRGSGSRGGKGNAGSGKRGDSKKPSFWKDMSYYKKKGFKSLRTPLKSINLKDLNKFKETTIDLGKEGFDKLLGTGSVSQKYNITVSYASASAVKKISDAGGTISGLIQKKKVKQAEAKEE
ncbi:MAG: uL15 family ribosomal protein [Nanoarchaeota archaeon]|nr:uL15 family ribosomal protein [Nanoarchaeota archaeon]MBU1269149.1 uL15 family ribosomal protein [Nanoarchaeota archaeon]MBU1605111.1 uL15 family ribosomal protein [Nanoarchaeota archaeon]MBU2442792.1 uL15 family ribosomal protein [Nanoarchaeota archaeon]